MKNSNPEAPVIVEEVFKTSKSVVWDAITDIGKMKQWFFKEAAGRVPIDTKKSY